MEYAEQLTQLTRLLEVSNGESHLGPPFASRPRLGRLQHFATGGLQRRRVKLRRRLAFVAQAFDDFCRLVDVYAEHTVLATDPLWSDDAHRMLDWLIETQSPTPRQRDYIACQQARYRIEDAVRRDRAAHAGFQKRNRESKRFLSSFVHDDSLRIHLNPIRFWTRFLTPELLENVADSPVNVLFFAGQGEIGTVVFELEGQALLNELSELAPCSFDEWSGRTEVTGRDQLAQLAIDLVGMGLLSIEAAGV